MFCFLLIVIISTRIYPMDALTDLIPSANDSGTKYIPLEIAAEADSLFSTILNETGITDLSEEINQDTTRLNPSNYERALSLFRNNLLIMPKSKVRELKADGTCVKIENEKSGIEDESSDTEDENDLNKEILTEKPARNTQCICNFPGCNEKVNYHMLNRHKLTHIEGLTCSYKRCKKTCENRVRLAAHIAEMHGNFRFRCMECSDRYNFFDNHVKLKEHKINIHNSYDCILCDKQIKIRNIAGHLKRVHHLLDAEAFEVQKKTRDRINIQLK